MKSNTTIPSPLDLKYFEEIALTGSLSRAAERLNIGQPGLSLSLKRLEALLDTKLFFRRSHGLSLTPSGIKLLRRCQKLQEEWALITTDVKNLEMDSNAVFRLGCHTAASIYCLNPFIHDIYNDYPGIQFNLTHGLSRKLCEQIISGSLDFGFIINPVLHPDLIIKKIAVDEVCFWAADQHIDEVVILNPELNQSQALIRKVSSRFKRFIYSESLEVIASLAKSGTGTAILPTRIAKALAPELKKAPGFPVFKDNITFVYRSDIQRTIATKLVLEHVSKLKI
jgi:DNA-binding transcriptional LysR family regulator